MPGMRVFRSKLKMANVIVTLKIMPQSPEADLDRIIGSVKEKIAEFAGEGETRTEIEPIAFGLKAVKLLFVMDEARGSTESLELEVAKIDDVNSVEITDVRRAVG